VVSKGILAEVAIRGDRKSDVKILQDAKNNTRKTFVRMVTRVGARSATDRLCVRIVDILAYSFLALPMRRVSSGGVSSERCLPEEVGRMTGIGVASTRKLLPKV